MTRLLKTVCGGDESNLALGVGDLYARGDRVRRAHAQDKGILLGEGMDFDSAMKLTKRRYVGIDSNIRARTNKAIRALLSAYAAHRRAKAEDYPLLMHIDELINRGSHGRTYHGTALRASLYAKIASFVY